LLDEVGSKGLAQTWVAEAVRIGEKRSDATTSARQPATKKGTGYMSDSQRFDGIEIRKPSDLEHSASAPPFPEVVICDLSPEWIQTQPIGDLLATFRAACDGGVHIIILAQSRRYESPSEALGMFVSRKDYEILCAKAALVDDPQRFRELLDYSESASLDLEEAFEDKRT